MAVLTRLAGERTRQDKKWGEQNHDPGKWSLILAEELGEACQAFLQGRHGDAVDELIQAAAVLVAWIECEERKCR